jgi:hypothetical protein
VRGILKFRLQHFQYALGIADNIIVPNANYPVSECAHRCVALGICSALCVLATIDLDHEMPLAAHKIREIRSDRLLTHEFAARKLPVAKVSPKHKSARVLRCRSARARSVEIAVGPRMSAPHPGPLPQAGRGRAAPGGSISAASPVPFQKSNLRRRGRGGCAKEREDDFTRETPWIFCGARPGSLGAPRRQNIFASSAKSFASSALKRSFLSTTHRHRSAGRSPAGGARRGRWRRRGR